MPTGCGLLLVPNKFLGLFLLPETNEVWIRVDLASRVISVGYHYPPDRGRQHDEKKCSTVNQCMHAALYSLRVPPH